MHFELFHCSGQTAHRKVPYLLLSYFRCQSPQATTKALVLLISLRIGQFQQPSQGHGTGKRDKMWLGHFPHSPSARITNLGIGILKVINPLWSFRTVGNLPFPHHPLSSIYVTLELSWEVDFGFWKRQRLNCRSWWFTNLSLGFPIMANNHQQEVHFFLPFPPIYIRQTITSKRSWNLRIRERRYKTVYWTKGMEDEVIRRFISWIISHNNILSNRIYQFQWGLCVIHRPLPITVHRN